MSDSFPEPDLTGDPSWKALKIPEILITRGTFLSGDPQGNRMRVRHYEKEDDQRLISKVWFGPNTEGPPGHVHGGAMAAIMDEVMGLVCWYQGHIVVAANLSFDYRSMLPLRSVTEVEAGIVKVQENKIHTECVLRGPKGAIHTEGRGLFVRVPPEKFKAFLDHLPADVKARMANR